MMLQLRRRPNLHPSPKPTQSIDASGWFWFTFLSTRCQWVGFGLGWKPTWHDPWTPLVWPDNYNTDFLLYLRTFCLEKVKKKDFPTWPDSCTPLIWPDNYNTNFLLYLRTFCLGKVKKKTVYKCKDAIPIFIHTSFSKKKKKKNSYTRRIHTHLDKRAIILVP